ncbi:Uncharacterised protein [Burkholderia cenocepacia]|nr:Uncharacterised protein [Burkholderia cenocepacia]
MPWPRSVHSRVSPPSLVSNAVDTGTVWICTSSPRVKCQVFIGPDAIVITLHGKRARSCGSAGTPWRSTNDGAAHSTRRLVASRRAISAPSGGAAKRIARSISSCHRFDDESDAVSENVTPGCSVVNSWSQSSN